MVISKRFSLWKEQAKCERVRHQKRPLLNNDVFQAGCVLKAFLHSTGRALEVHLA